MLQYNLVLQGSCDFVWNSLHLNFPLHCLQCHDRVLIAKDPLVVTGEMQLMSRRSQGANSSSFGRHWDRWAMHIDCVNPESKWSYQIRNYTMENSTDGDNSDLPVGRISEPRHLNALRLLSKQRGV